MVINKVLQIWNPLLNKKSKTVKDVKSTETQEIIKNLIDSMRDSKLVWLSAVQIWDDKRIFVTEIKETKYRKPDELDWLKVYINPKIIWFSIAQCLIYEGCGSVGDWDIFWPVKRPKWIVIEAHDENWKKFTLKATWLLARVIQHEYDHLEWINFMERVTDMHKLTNRENYKRHILKEDKKIK